MIESEIRVSIFHTNDMHGRLDDMARLSSYVHQLRTEAEGDGAITFLWDAGDAADRRVPFCGATKGAAFPQILNAMGYSLQAMGNAISVTYGPQFITDVAARANFPILAANFRDGEGPLVPGIQEYKLIQLTDSVKIGVIGLTASARNFYKLFGLNIPDTQDLTRKLIPKLKAEGANIIIVLSHLGFNDDKILADEVEGIDVIIGGHSHTRIENGEICNKTLITQTGALAKTVGRVDLIIDAISGGTLSRSAVLINIPEHTEQDPAVLQAIATAEVEAQEVMAQPIGVLADDFTHEFFNECGIGNLAADALKERFQADLAILTGGLFHGPLKAGTLTLGELDKACFTTANPWLSEITGKQLLASLEHGLDPELMNFEHGSLRGSPVGIPQISGLQVHFDGNAQQAPRIQKVLVNNQPLDPNKTYQVAHTDAETMSDVGCLLINEEQTIKQEIPTILREVMADYIKANEPVLVPEDKRWVDTTHK